MKKVIVLNSEPSYPPFSGARVRNYYLWQYFLELNYEVKILSLNPYGIRKPKGPLNCQTSFYNVDRPHIFKKLFRRLNYSFHQYRTSQDLNEAINNLINEWSPDIIHGEELRMAPFILDAKKGNYKTSIVSHNVESELLQQIGTSSIKLTDKILSSLQLKNLQKLELQVARKFNFCFAFSSVDKKKYESNYPFTKWLISTNGVDTNSIKYQQQIQSNSIVFVGNLSYYPNVQGLKWFLEHCWKNLKDTFHLQIVGASLNSEFHHYLNGFTNVNIKSSPEDLTPFYKNSFCSIVPLFNGSGSRGKILESLAYGRNVVTTTIGREGLDLNPQHGLYIADSADEFIREIKTVYNIDRDSFAKSGREYIEQNYNWKVIAKNLVENWEKS